MTEGVLQFVVQPTIAGIFAVLVALVTARLSQMKPRPPGKKRHGPAHPSKDLGVPAPSPGQSGIRSKRVAFALFTITLAVAALTMAVLRLLGAFETGRISISIFVTVASLAAFTCGVIIIWAGPKDGASEAERRLSKMLTRVFVCVIAPIAGITLSLGLSRSGPVPLKTPFAVSAYYAPSGFMGDTAHITLRAQSTQNCKIGPSCMKFEYRPTDLPEEPGWAGVYWQSPPNNWGDQPGRKVEGAKKLLFWARGEMGKELVSFRVGGIHAPGKKYKDSLDVTMNPSPIQLTSDWQQYQIDLDKADMSSVIGAFSWSIARDGNPQGATFYLDGIEIE